MCCFSGKTEVHGTTIFARATSPDTQVLVYQMQYAAKEPTAMILPLPVALPASEGTVTWKSFKEYPDFFASLDAGFPAEEERSSGAKSAAVSNDAPIAVHEVGDFIASFVPSQADFGRVDKRFQISADVWSKIPEYRDYGFAVFQLKELSGSPHPIAFEFKTRTRGKLYFPTVHIHDGTVHDKDEFDHVLYLQDARFDDRTGSYAGRDKADEGTGFVRSKDQARTFADVSRAMGALDGDMLVHKTTMSGLLPNTDTIVGGDAMPTVGCGRCDVAPRSATFGPSGAAIAGLAWIIRRREALRAKR